MNMKLHTDSRFDILIAGAGLAGIRAAASCARNGMRVLLATPSRLCSGSSFYPMMDTIHCLCTAGPGDREAFMKDIEDCSWSMNDPWMGQYYVDHIEECLEHMAETGIRCHKLPERKLACFGHTERDLYYWKDWDRLREEVRNALGSQERITVAGHRELVQLLTVENRINGAILLGPDGLETLSVKAVILASGGMGNLYLHSLNTADISGSAHVIAMKAGARLINLEFNQFIPGFLSPAYKTVFREGSLRYCTGLLEPNGHDVLRQLLPDQDAYRKCLMLREPHGPFTTADDSKYFDIALMKSALKNIGPGGAVDRSVGCIIRYSPDILNDSRGPVRDYISWLLMEHGIHIERDPISIAPFFHAANGGIQVGHDCSTSVKGLYACGEAAGGIHGADRLGGMASGSCLVFGSLAADSASSYAAGMQHMPVTQAQAWAQMAESYVSCRLYGADGTAYLPPMPPSVSQPPAGFICRRVRELMWQHAGILRSMDNLKSTLDEINALALLADTCCSPDSCEGPDQLRSFLKAHQYVDLSRVLLIAMMERNESRGSHYREDAPDKDDAHYLHRISIGLEGNRYNVRKIP